MRRLLAAGFLAVAAAAPAAHAAPPLPGGYCDGTVDAVCRTDRCGDNPCTPQVCVVWVKSCQVG